jgi:hypothetical protein
MFLVWYAVLEGYAAIEICRQRHRQRQRNRFIPVHCHAHTDTHTPNAALLPPLLLYLRARTIILITCSAIFNWQQFTPLWSKPSPHEFACTPLTVRCDTVFIKTGLTILFRYNC